MKKHFPIPSQHDKALLSRAAIWLTMSLIAVSSLLMTSPTFAQPNSNYASSRAARTRYSFDASIFKTKYEVDPQVEIKSDCSGSGPVELNRSQSNQIKFFGATVNNLPVFSFQIGTTNITGGCYSVGWNIANITTKAGCEYGTAYFGNNMTSLNPQPNAVPITYQLNGQSQQDTFTLTTQSNQPLYASSLTFPLLSITTTLNAANPGDTVAIAPFYMNCNIIESNNTPVQTMNGITYKFTIASKNEDPDGWCQGTADPKTFTCRLNWANQINFNADESSPPANNAGEWPYCQPSWLPSNFHKRHRGGYSYSCRFAQ